MAVVSVRALLFTDIEGSTTLVRRLGERYEGVLDRHHVIIRSAAAVGSGVEQSRQGDSLFITFSSVTAALQGALDAQVRLERESWPPDGRVRVRMGLHVGEVAETRAGLVGVAIHQAARIMSAAHGGQIVVSGDVVEQADTVGDEVSTRPLGVYDLRDVGRVRLFQVDHPDLQHEFPGLRTRRAVAHNLPMLGTSLVGRVAEAEAVAALLDDCRLVTLLGEGGCGKTRLALRVAGDLLDRFTDGVWFVDLAALSPGADVTARVAEVLGVGGGLDEVACSLDERDVLVVLDNCEHVIASTATLVTELLHGGVRANVMATSRAPLEVAGEARYHVPPLRGPRRGADRSEAEASDAVQLFTTRAELVRPGFHLAEGDVETIVELCARLDGLPLAIELAAARLRGMSLAELATRMDDLFGVLVGGPRTAPDRQRSLRNTVEWSFRLLDPDEQHVLCHLAAFRGGCDLESAEAVCGPEGSSPARVLDVLMGLIDKSLVTAVETDAATRYGLHETIREYALASLSSIEREAIADRHARWFAELASRLRVGPAQRGERAWIRRHDDERDNLRAAAEWFLVHDPPAALRLLLDIEHGMDFTTQYVWHDELLRRSLRLAVDAPPADRAHGLALLAFDEQPVGGPSRGQLISEAVKLLEDVDDPVVESAVLTAVARRSAETGGGFAEGEVAAAVDAADRAGGTFWPIINRQFLAHRAPSSIAESLNTDALRIAEGLGLELFGAITRGELATIEQFRGESADVLASWRLVNLSDEPLAYQSDHACFYAVAEAEHGELAVGLHIAEHFAVELDQHAHDPRHAARLYCVVAHLRRLAGDLEGADAALQLAGRAGEPESGFVGGLATITRSALWRHRGQPQTAAAVIEPACSQVEFHGVTDIPMRVIEELAAVALALDRREDAADLLATARETRHREHKPLNPASRTEVTQTEETVGQTHGKPLDPSDVLAIAFSMAHPASP